MFFKVVFFGSYTLVNIYKVVRNIPGTILRYHPQLFHYFALISSILFIFSSFFKESIFQMRKQVKSVVAKTREYGGCSRDVILCRARYSWHTLTIAYADDLTVLVQGRTILEVQEKTNRAIYMIKDWLTTGGLKLSVEKCKFIMFTGKRELDSPDIMVDGLKISEVNSLKYLVVTLEKSCKFTQHIINVCNKAESMTKSLNAIVSTKKAPKSSKRNLIASTVVSSMLFCLFYRL